MERVSEELANQFGVPAGKGVLVDDVIPDSPAAEAGVKSGDVIVELAGKPVGSTLELQGTVEETTVGQRLPLTVIREGKRVTLQVTTKEQPADYGLAMGDSKTPGKGKSAKNDKLGLEVGNLTGDVAEKLGVKAGEGVVITEVQPGSPAELAGLASGMVILQANKKPVKSVDDYRAAMGDQPLEKGVLMLIRTPQGNRYVVIRSS